MASNELGEKINNLIESDDTENFYSLISEIIEENREYISDLDQNLNEAFRIIFFGIFFIFIFSIKMF